METHIDVKNFPPDLIFSPTITDAEITIEEFRLDRVSKLGGEVAQQLTRRARKELERHLGQVGSTLPGDPLLRYAAFLPGRGDGSIVMDTSLRLRYLDEGYCRRFAPPPKGPA